MGDGTGFEMEIVGENFFSDGVVEVHCCFWGIFFHQSQLDIFIGGKVVIGASRLFRLSLSRPSQKKDAFFKEEEIKT